MICQFENLVSSKERAILIRTCKPPPHPAITYRHSVNIEALPIFDRLGFECSQRATAAFGLPIKTELPAVMLSRMGPGDYLVRHADNCRQDVSGNWVPNHTPHRDFSAAYYLSDDFEGGELYFPQHNVTVKKQSGLLTIFPSTQHFVHEVKPITKGVFYALLVFMEKVNKDVPTLPYHLD